MSTITPNKGYTVPTVGGDTNNWGTELNATLGIIDDNLGGSLIKAVDGNTNVTLSSTEAHNLLYVLTGVLTGNISVLWPATIGLYLVNNQTTGAFTITLGSTTPGATVTVSQGGFAIIYTDGTNFFSLPSGIALFLSALTVSGTANIGGTLSVVTVLVAADIDVAGGIDIGDGLEVNGPTTLSGTLILGPAEIAATGTDQASAAQIVSTTAFISGGGAGVKLPPATAGLTVIVGNPQGATVLLYPGSGALINYRGVTGGANVAVTLAGQTTISCYARNSTTWMCN